MSNATFTSTEIIKLFDLNEASGYLHLSAEHLRKLCREGKVPCRKIRRRFYMTPADVNSILEGRA